MAAADLVIGADGRARPIWASSDPILQKYYDEEWGVPVRDERGLFERISLEAFQAGLSWRTVLTKREALRRAFASFQPDDVAKFDDRDVERLLSDAAIIRNRRKILATVKNARATVNLREFGGLAGLVWSFAPGAQTMAAELEVQSSPESVALAKQLRAYGFTFVGPVTVFALMQAIGMVDTYPGGSHHARNTIFERGERPG